ncbi:hypothetical protein AB0L99_42495 [Streptomyces sp. NPDC051954]|uniref:hypothetical protein n=1 Tax=Streptomyces sp. NPDC051954 TaxID=3155524 RepID=UPI0034237F4D
MPENTQTADTAATPTGYGYCAWHKKFSAGVRLIQIDDAGSGPSRVGSLYACGPCRESHHLVPLADRP